MLSAAHDLFYSQGPAVGLGALLAEADVARRSLYEHFGDKDGLVVAVLRRAADDDIAWYEQALDAGSDSRERILGLFDRLDELVAAPEFRGCRYLAVDLAIPDPTHPAHAETKAYRARLRALLRREVREFEHLDPDEAAAQLHLLIEGVLVSGAAHDDEHPARVARQLAAGVLG